jgi:hypothetical protein
MSFRRSVITRIGPTMAHEVKGGRNRKDHGEDRCSGAGELQGREARPELLHRFLRALEGDRSGPARSAVHSDSGAGVQRLPQPPAKAPFRS